MLGPVKQTTIFITCFFSVLLLLWLKWQVPLVLNWSQFCFCACLRHDEFCSFCLQILCVSTFFFSPFFFLGLMRHQRAPSISDDLDGSVSTAWQWDLVCSAPQTRYCLESEVGTKMDWTNLACTAYGHPANSNPCSGFSNVEFHFPAWRRVAETQQ